MSATELDTTNYGGVASAGDEIVILINRPRLTKEQAINLAAWLVVMADGNRDDEARLRFSALVHAIGAS